MKNPSENLRIIAPHHFIPTKPASHPSIFLTILGILIITVFIFYMFIDFFTKDSFFTLKIDSNIIVKNYLWDKLLSKNSRENNLTTTTTMEKEDFRGNNIQTSPPAMSNKSSDKNVKGFEPIPKFNKFISCTFRTCSGIGNQMFRFASLYSIGRYFNRSAYFNAANRCQKNTMPEIKEIFPNFYNNIQLLNPPNNFNETLHSDFALDCCHYQNPNTMHDVPQKYLILNGNYLQSFKYFDSRKHEIRYFFDFSQKIKDSVEKVGSKMFGSDPSHKLCIHIRRGDFLIHEQLESRAEFIEPAISFLYSNLTQKEITNISIIFLGNDLTFTNSLKFNRTQFQSIYTPRLKSRGEDMHFGIKYCNTLLISGSGSTFAWWIGYFMPDGSQIFYNAQVSKKRDYVKDLYDFDFFPNHWNMLELNKTIGKVEMDNRWFYERFSWPRKGIPPLF